MTPAQARLKAAELRLYADRLEDAAASAEAAGRDLDTSDLDGMIASAEAAAAELRQALGLQPLE